MPGAVPREGEGLERRPDQYVAQGPEPPHEAKNVRDGLDLDRRARVGATSYRLAEEQAHQHGEDDAGSADDEERHSPAELVREDPAEGEAEERADRYAESVDGERRGAPLRREVVRDQRVRWRRAARLADPDPDACQQQLSEGSREARHHGHRAPHRECHGDQIAAVATVRESREGEACKGVEDCESGADQRADLGIRQPEIRPHRLDQDVHDLAIDVVDGVDHDQQEERGLRPGRDRGVRARGGGGVGCVHGARQGTTAPAFRARGAG